MSPYRRNVLVGMTVLAALLILGWMIIQFGGSLGTAFGGEKIPIRFTADRSDGISPGSAIRYLGTQVGTIKTVALNLKDNNVLLTAELDKDKPLPSNVRGSIKIPNLLGAGAIIELELTSPVPSPTPLRGDEMLIASYAGLGLLPPDLGDLSAELKVTVRQIREANIAQNFSKLTVNLNEQVTKAGATLDSINAVIGTEATQTDIKTAIARFREAVDRANNITKNVEAFSADIKTLPADVQATLADICGATGDARKAINSADTQISAIGQSADDNLSKLAGTLDSMRSITARIDAGEGTLGKVVNDPKLYDTLVTSTQTLEAAIKDLQRYLRQIEQEGLTLRVK